MRQASALGPDCRDHGQRVHWLGPMTARAGRMRGRAAGRTRWSFRRRGRWWISTAIRSVTSRRRPRARSSPTAGRQLAHEGCSELPGFLTPEATERMVKESETLVPVGHHARGPITAYLEIPDPSLPETHPRRTVGLSSLAAIAYDLIPADHALRRLYEWDGLVRFLEVALGVACLHRYADPMGALNVAVMKQGDELYWHFDQCDFVTSIALRDASDGGRLRVRAEPAPGRRRELRRGEGAARRLARAREARADDARDAAAVPGPPLDPPRDADRRARLPARGPPRLRRTARRHGDRSAADGSLRPDARASVTAGEEGSSSQTVLACEHLAFSGRTLGGEPELVRALLQVKKAAALANAAAGVLAEDVAAAIAQACDALLAAPPQEAFCVDVLAGGGGIAHNVNVNEVIAARASVPGRPVDPKRDVNASQSSADVCHTAFRLALQERWDGLLGRTGRAGWEPAGAGAGIRAGHDVDAYLPARCTPRLVRRPAGWPCRIDRPAARGDRAGSGGALAREPRRHGGRLGDGAPAAYRERIVGALERVTGRTLTRRANLFDAAQNSDDLGAVSASLAQLAVALLKLAQDLRLLSSGPETGFGELRLPHVMEGSSFFAGKRNPVVPESLMQCCLVVLGCDHAVQLACARAELQLNVFEAVAVVGALDAMAMLTRAIERFDRSCVRGLEADEERCREHARHAHPR